MSKKCTSCRKKFTVFNINRIKCMECDQGFCQQCIRKGNGLKLYCSICLLLNARPVDRSIIMDIRTKDVKLYLERRNVRTDRCLEKEDLVNCFVYYVNKEPTLSNNSKAKTKLLNGLFSAFTNSMPNLSEQNFMRSYQTSGNESSRNIYEQPSSSQRSTNIPPYHANAQPQQNIPTPQSPPPPQQQQQQQQQQQTPSSPPPPPNSAPESNTSQNSAPRKLMKLTDIQNVEDIPSLSVKHLKELLFINRIDFKGCVEKEELVKKVVNLWIETQNAEEPENLAGEDLCKICMDAPLNSVLLECGHIATCINCGKQLAECPICRQYIVRVVHTFKA